MSNIHIVDGKSITVKTDDPRLKGEIMKCTVCSYEWNAVQGKTRNMRTLYHPKDTYICENCDDAGKVWAARAATSGDPLTTIAVDVSLREAKRVAADLGREAVSAKGLEDIKAMRPKRRRGR